MSSTRRVVGLLRVRLLVLPFARILVRTAAVATAPASPRRSVLAANVVAVRVDQFGARFGRLVVGIESVVRPAFDRLFDGLLAAGQRQVLVGSIANVATGSASADVAAGAVRLNEGTAATTARRAGRVVIVVAMTTIGAIAVTAGFTVNIYIILKE